MKTNLYSRVLALAALTLVAPVLLAGPKHDLCLQQKGSITWPFYYATNPLYDKLCPLIAAVEENEQKLVPQMRIVLVDPCWDPDPNKCGWFGNDSGYDKSDLKRYLYEVLGKKIGPEKLEAIENQIYLVAQKFNQYGWIRKQLLDFVKAGGIVLLADLERGKTAGAVAALYSFLWKNAPNKKNVQYTDVDTKGTEVVWYGDYDSDDDMLAILHHRLAFLKKQDDLFASTTKRAWFSAEPKDLPKGGRTYGDKIDFQLAAGADALRDHVKRAPLLVTENPAIQSIWIKLFDGGQVFDVESNGKVKLTKDFFVNAPLPYMIVSNDQAVATYPLLEYELDVTKDPNKWELVHKLGWKTDQLKHLGDSGDLLGDLLKNFSASLETLGAQLKRV